MSEVKVYVDVQASAVTPELLEMIAAQGWTPRFVGEATNEVAPAPEVEAPAPTPEPEAEVNEAWTSATGYECTGRWPARHSSNKVWRHLTGACWCRTGGTAKCKAVSKGFSTADEFNTRPDAELVEDEVAQSFSIVG